MASFNTVPIGATAQPTPFHAFVPQEQIDEMKQLLNLSKLGPVTYEGTREDRQYGITNAWLKEAKDEWLHRFDWRHVESEINSVPNFTLPIQHKDNIFNVHFLALFSSNPKAIPVLLLHGWPGSILEFLPTLRRLSSQHTTSTLPYHIIVPSLLGYGFSSPPPTDVDFRLEDVTAVLDSPMVQLGFDKPGYVVQGGDIGSKLARILGATSPNVKGVHINFANMPDPGNIAESAYSALEKAGLERADWFKRLGSAYALEHATKPSTLSLVLHSSPLAMLAWIGEKFLDWTDEPGLPLQTILADVSLYWLTNTFATTIYPYRQLSTPGVMGAHENPEWKLNVPFGYSFFPKEVAPIPKAWVETTGNLIFHREHDKGGHFAALEVGEVLWADFEEFVGMAWKD